MGDFLRGLSDRHEQLKKRFHSFRIPLSPNGRRIMGFVYFTIPVICGYYIMQGAIYRAETNVGAKGERVVSRASAPEEARVKEQNKALQDLLDKIKMEKERRAN